MTNANGKSYGYDANGNMTALGSQTLVYDTQNRLTEVWSGTNTVFFGYSDGGARLWRQGATTTVWIGGLYEERAGKTLCHAVVDGRRIATFEPQGGTAAIIHEVPWLAAALGGIEKALTWSLQGGRTPVTVAIASCSHPATTPGF